MTREATDTPGRLDRLDRVLLAAIGAFLLAHLGLSFDSTLPPYEDAAILMRYSKHLAEGHGVVWNVGAQPVDGATDFLFMAGVAAVAALGTSVEAATRGLGLVAHVLTVLLLFGGIRRLHRAPRWAALLSALFLALGPGLRYAEAGFGASVFALFGCTTWLLAYEEFRFGPSRKKDVLFAVSALLLGLTRPEGVFLGLFVLAALVMTRGWRTHRATVVTYALVFGLPGAAYFLWHWAHFGYPLPNTYYIKGRGIRPLFRLRNGTRQLVELVLPFAPILAFAGLAALGRWVGERWGADARRRRAGPDPRETLFVLLPPVAFTLLGILHAGLMDFLSRFQYVLVPLVLLSWPPLLRGSIAAVSDPGPRSIGPRAVPRVLLVLLFCALALGRQLGTYGAGTYREWGTLNVARVLADYPGEYTIAVTNAGHLPLYSGWNAIDGWGLNDQEVAHDGLSAELLARHRPEVIQFDAGFSPLAPERQPSSTPWSEATRVMHDYAVRNGYVLAAAFGTGPHKAHYYYVRSDVPERDEMVDRIRALDYRFGGAPRRCLDLAALARGDG